MQIKKNSKKKMENIQKLAIHALPNCEEVDGSMHNSPTSKNKKIYIKFEEFKIN